MPGQPPVSDWSELLLLEPQLRCGNVSKSLLLP